LAEFDDSSCRGATVAVPCNAPNKWRENAVSAAATQISGLYVDKYVYHSTFDIN